MLEMRPSAAGVAQAPMVQVAPIAPVKSMSMGMEVNAFGAGQVRMVQVAPTAQQRCTNIKLPAFRGHLIQSRFLTLVSGLSCR